MNNSIRAFERNTAGRDLIVGDIHGHFDRLHAALVLVGFDGARDRLFSVGDLVDRGPQSPKSLTWLKQPWFFACRGNHEEAVMAWAEGRMDRDRYRSAFGGDWLAAGIRPWHDAEPYAAAFRELPIGMEIQTASGIVGVLHADCPRPTWASLKEALGGPRRGPQPLVENVAAAMCAWSRKRFEEHDDSGIPDLRALVLGHEPVDRWTMLGNVHYIDTKAWTGGHFTLLNAATLRPEEPEQEPALSWEGVE